jgi:D-galactose 1-dehydrogenase
MTAPPIRIALIGYGKIAIDQHIPAIMANPAFELAAVVSARGEGPAGVPVFRSLDDLSASGIAIAATTHCNTPRARLDSALASIDAGWHCMLEKPPTASLREWQMVENAALASSVTVFTAWHSQANAAVDAARDWLADKAIGRVEIQWHEDVRKWHPGQEWIWEPGGFGVFDPGINALSIATKILPFQPFVDRAQLLVPANRAMPIAAQIQFDAPGWDGGMTASFDWRVGSTEQWTITADTDGGRMELSGGGRRLRIDGADVMAHGDEEYPRLYAEFAQRIADQHSGLDPIPLQLVADAFLLGRRETVEAFE